MAEIRMAQGQPDEMIVEGYAIVFDEPTVLFEEKGIKYNEIIQRGALDDCDMSDVPFKYNHSVVMARTRNKTLQLTVDEKGLFFRASLANTNASKDLFSLISRGDVDKMSFGFKVQSDSYDNRSRTRNIEKIKKLYDVSAVDDPAYSQTSISARSYFDGQLEIEKLTQQEQLRKKLIVVTYL